VITALAPSPSLDVTYAVDGFRIGELHRPTAVHRVSGGKGLNCARAALRLGADVTAVALLGGDGGRWIEADVARLGLPLVVVPVAAPTRTCVSVADPDRETMTEIYEPAGPVTAAEWERFADAVGAAVAGRPGWVTLSGSLPHGTPDGAVAHLVGAVHAAGRSFAVDVHGAALREALAAGVDVVKVNTAEAAEALDVGPTIDTRTDTSALARALAGRTRVGAVVTAGVDGAVAVLPDGASRWARSARRGPFPVGSGDCFLAGLVSGLDRGLPLLDCLPVATAVATANALSPAPACFADGDLRAALADLEISPSAR